ncbi:MAG TPA: AarF/UbiB family protein [Candidatus Thermoplasmatota archaeon]|nr:AarF/UbiB family protein [Candidatus Thermoplasmatota archaeon]
MAEETAISKLQRTVEIVRILYRNDFFGMMRELALAERSGLGPSRRELAIPPDMPRKVRLMLEELGPTFVKIGQLLGTRPDLVPKPFVDEFRHLYDKTTPSPYEEVKRVIENELGRPLLDVFSGFDEVAIASASIGQVHFATLKNGERVAVKVQKPGSEERVFTDFQIMEPLVRFVENLFAASRIWQPREHLLEVYAMLVKELDYRYEAANHQKVFESFAGRSDVKIPRIFWDYSGRRVLTLERIEGVKFSDFDNPAFEKIDRPRLARIITYAMAKQIFEDRLFHADPSPGNLMAIPTEDGGVIAFLDFGAVGKVTRRRSERILSLIMGFVRNDLESVSQSLIEICNVFGEVDIRSLHRDVEKIMDYHERERASVGDPVVLDMIIQVAQKHNMLLPPDFMLITRALFQFEGLCKKLDPEYELVAVLEPYVLQYIRKEAFTVENRKEALIDMAYQMSDFLKQMPHRMASIVRKIEQNEVRLKVDLPDFPQHREIQEKKGFKQNLTILLGALILGVAVVLGLGRGEQIVSYVFVAFVFVLLWSFVMLVLSD